MMFSKQIPDFQFFIRLGQITDNQITNSQITDYTQRVEMMPQLDLINRNSWLQICRNITITIF